MDSINNSSLAKSSFQIPFLRFETDEKVKKILIGLIVFLFTLILFKKYKNNIDRDKKNKELVKIQISYIFCYILLFIGIIISLTIVGIPYFTLISIFSFIGIALGLALKPSVSRIISSFELVFQNEYKMGDTITHYNSNSKMSIKGIITDFNLLSTSIKTADNEEYIIPNDMINNNIIIK